MSVVFALVLLVAIAAFVTYPFWGKGDSSSTEDPEIAALEAAREAKYREIRDAEIDRESGKLSEEDYKELEAELKREAVAILDRLEALEGEES